MKKFALRGMVILAAAVALCIFFSGTVRTLTTPKARFAQIRTGKMEQEIDLTGKVVFPEEEELTYSIPEGMTLTVTRVHVTAGSKVKAGDPLVSTRVTDGEKTLESLKKDLATAQKELRTLETKTAGIRLTRSEEKWQETWNRENEARGRAQEARISLMTALRQAGLEWNGKDLPEGAGEEAQELYAAWQQAEKEASAASDALKALERYAIPDETWTAIQQKQEQTRKAADLENQILTLQVLEKTAEKITAPREGYVTEISLEKGATLDADSVILKMTAEGSQPVIRVDLSDVKQEVKKGTTLMLEGDSWDRPSVKVTETGLNAEGRPYADAEITKDVTYALGSVSALMKKEIKAQLVVRSQEATCLVPAAAVRGSGDSRYVYVGETERSAFSGSRMIVRKTDVRVLAESGSICSLAEDLTGMKVLYMEDRALTEGGAVMEYTKE
ncbi:MAG: hypothetical protein J6J41_01510 [Clostridia bacterium]|nr:hypothetical protein [Clostridia bacterium]